MKTKAEIVVETLKFYNTNNRGFNYEHECCTYHDASTNNKCAVGRCILDNELEKVSAYEAQQIEDYHSSPDFENLVIKFPNFDSLMCPEYRGHDIEFWSSLQLIHDSPSFWDENGFIVSEKILDRISSYFGKEVENAVRIAFSESVVPEETV